MPIRGRAIDLHCDLLLYLAKNPRRRPWDPLARASVPKMAAGGLGTQVLAVFSWLHGESVELGARQLEIFEALDDASGGATRRLAVEGRTHTERRDAIEIVAALESGVTFATEIEPLSQALDRLETILERFGPILYISLTWNEENRFGGGNESDVGLKPDGRTLLEFLSGRRVAIDLSHTSDALADGILDAIDAGGLELPLLASHSNFRALCDVPRNLPDRIAREIIARRGVIGLNFLERFVGEGAHVLLDHVEHGIHLGGTENLALGADYFSTFDVPALAKVAPEALPPATETPATETPATGTPATKTSYFFAELPDSSSYPWLFESLAERVGDAATERIQRGNAAAFVERLWRAD